MLFLEPDVCKLKMTQYHIFFSDISNDAETLSNR